MSDEKQIALFTKWADHKYGKAMPPKFWPQMQRFQSYWECWQAALASQPKPAPVLLTDEAYAKAAVLLTNEEIDDLARTMVKGCKSVNWLASAIESAVLRKNGWGG